MSVPLVGVIVKGIPKDEIETVRQGMRNEVVGEDEAELEKWECSMERRNAYTIYA